MGQEHRFGPYHNPFSPFDKTPSKSFGALATYQPLMGETIRHNRFATLAHHLTYRFGGQMKCVTNYDGSSGQVAGLNHAAKLPTC